MAENESRGPSHGEIADMVRLSELEPHLNPIEMYHYLLDRHSQAIDRGNPEEIESIELQLGELVAAVPDLRSNQDLA